MRKYFCIFLLLIFAACSKQMDVQSPGLSIKVSVDGEFTTKSTVPDVPALMENNLSGGLDVYIVGHGVFLRHRVRSAEDGKVHFLTSSWKQDGIVPGQTYDVYVIANPEKLAGPAEDISSLLSLMLRQDEDIYKLYDPEAGTYDLAKTREKSFLMDGYVQWTPTSQLEQTINVTLHRAAAKIHVDFNLGPTLRQNWRFFGAPQWKLLNYAYAATALENGSADASSFTSTPLLMPVAAASQVGGSITTYSYPREWTDDAEATVILLNVPLIDSEGNILDNNYYTLPVLDLALTAPFSIKRNGFYRVEATLESLGSSSEQGADPALALEYQVLPWEYNSVTDNITVIGQEVEYLMVDPTYYEIREKVLADKLTPNIRFLNFWASGTIVCSSPEVYYYDKTGARVDASATSPVTVTVSGNRTGTIGINSTALGNNSVKYIRFRVSLSHRPGVYEDIFIRHYPLDYIQNIEGLWSSLTTDGWVNWITDQSLHTPMRTVNNSIFSAKVISGGNIYGISEYRVGSNYYQARPGYNYSNLKNNRMYIVQITSTSDDYTVGRVNLDSNYQSQEHLVSPAFMIASQLGATQTTSNALTAAMHCGSYKEVTADGTEYTGWRLPTREEIGIIMGYQYSSDAIDVVLAGSHYWTLEGKCVSRDNPSNTSYDVNTGYIRCVRDLTLSDVEQFNKLQ